MDFIPRDFFYYGWELAIIIPLAVIAIMVVPGIIVMLIKKWRRRGNDCT